MKMITSQVRSGGNRRMSSGGKLRALTKPLQTAHSNAMHGSL